MENYRLSYENTSLKKEKNFLIDQIKFMQNLIKSNNLNIRKEQSYDIEKNVSTKLTNDSPERNIYYNGNNQRSLGRIFSVFVVCLLSISYVSFDSGSDSGEKIVINKSGSVFSLNDASERIEEKFVESKFNSMYSNIFNLAFVFICGFITWNFTYYVSKIKNYVYRKIKNN